MLNAFVAWWARQMLDLFGGSLAARDSRTRTALVIERLDGEPVQVAVTRRQNRRETAVGRYRLDEAGLAMMQIALRGVARAGAVILRLPAHLLLEQEVTLPLLAEREPERVLGYEMERLTPFAAAEVFWTWSLARRDRAAGRVHLRLSLVPRLDIDAVVTMLARAGVVPSVLEVPTAEGAPRMIALRHAIAGRRPRLVMAGAICCAMLGLVAVMQPFVLQTRALSRSAEQLAVLRPQIAEVETLRRQITGRTADTDVVAAERGRVGDVLAVLATVTEILPDDAFLTAFTLGQRKMTMDGRAGAAARLIAALAADPTLRNPTFAAPVIREANSHTDLFSIHADLAP